MEKFDFAGGLPISIRMSVAPLCAAALLSSCAQAPVPVQAPPPPAPIVSYINIPISIPLSSLEQAMNANMRKSIGVEPFRMQLNGGAGAPACGEDVGYSIERGPVALSGAGEKLLTQIEVRYWLKGRKQLPCPGSEVVASCGTDGETPRTARAAIESTIEIPPDLATRVHSTAQSPVAVDRCVLQPVGLDITQPLMGAFETTLRELLPEADKRIGAILDLRARMQAGWDRMSEPREVQAGVWLAWNPEGVGIVPVTVADGALHTGVQLRVRPAIVAGAKPAAATKPLPLAYGATRDDTFRLQLPVDVEAAFVQQRLDKALGVEQGGMLVSVGNMQTRIAGADVTGEGSQIHVTLRFEGDLRGTALLTGTPIYDTGTRTLTFPDLDYVLDSDQFLLKSASAVAHSQVRDRLRQRFTIELGDRIDQLRGGLEALLNRRNDNVQLHGKVTDLALLGVSRRQGGPVFTAYLAAGGTVSAEIELAR